MPQPRKIGLFPVFLSVFIASLFVFSFLLPAKAQAAASLYIEPAAGTFTLDSTFTVSVYVNTDGQAVNAVEANLRFPVDKLQVVSPTAGKSLIQVWVAQPTYSNTEGTIKFQGTIPTPGINTSAGLISTITFRVKNIGVAAIKILDSSRVLLNDGRGTDILGQTSDGIYNLVLPPPAGPIVTSRTNPDQGKWYSQDHTVFEWNAPVEVQGYSYILSNSPVEEPDDISEGLKTRVAYENLADGAYYFHIKALRQGIWGGVTTYIVNIDATPPAEFPINFSPSSRTSNRRPLIDFSTTDKTSGIDHYELKIIPLDAPEAYAGNASTPFFFETISPYSREFADGRYEVIVRAYDAAGNYYQAEDRLTVTRPLFELILSDGLRIGGGYVVAWPWLALIGAIILLLLGYLAKGAWKLHRLAEERLSGGPMKHPEVAAKLEQLKAKQKDYDGGKSLMVVSIILLFVFSLGLAVSRSAFAQNAGTDVGSISLQPPVVNLFPKVASNDEIVYIGGRASAPQAKVLIYLQNVETGSTISHVAVTDKDGAWFYSFPSFMNPGNYVVWTQLQIGQELSPPSSRLDLSIARTAVQIGGQRLSFEDLYFILLIVFIIAFLALFGWTVYHSYHGRSKHKKFDQAVKEAEESIRRGFAVLRKDIEEDLATLHRAKRSKELSAEEKLREEKLLKDMEEVSQHLGKEIWQIEHTE